MEKISKEEKTTKEEEFKKSGVFGIQQFLKTAKDEFDLKEGNWFRSTTFLMGLDYILKRHPRVIGGVDLQVYNMNDNIIFLNEVFNKMFEPETGDTFKLGALSGLKEMEVTQMKLSDIMNIEELKMELPKNEELNIKTKEEFSTPSKKLATTILKNPETKISFSENESETQNYFDFEKISDYRDYLKNHEPAKPLLLCLNTMLGLNKIDPIHKNFIEDLYDLPSFVGMLGGKEYKAFYFFGYNKKEFYFLDPHYVKSSHGKEYSNEDYIKDYFYKTIFKMKYKHIAPSLTICFLIQSSKGNLTKCGLFFRFPRIFGCL